MSAQAAMIELSTIKPNENKAMDETAPPNHSTSPYAIKMIVKFLKIVYTGIERYRRAQVLVYIIAMRRSEIGNPGLVNLCLL